MSWLQEWVQTIIILVFFAGFLELLLPSGNMKPTVQVLVGLFVLTLILGPITSLMGYIRHQPEIHLPVLAETETTTVLTQGEQLQEQQLEHVLFEYKSNVAQQVNALIKLTDETLEAEVMVDILSNPNQTDFGQLRSLHVTLLTLPSHERELDFKTMASFLADFYGLSKDKVIVTCVK